MFPNLQKIEYPKTSTFLTNSILAFIGAYLDYKLDSFYLFPILFSIGTPLINLKGNFWKKLKLTFVIAISITSIILLTIGFSFAFGLILIPVLLTGFAGSLSLWIFSLTIEKVKPPFLIYLITFILCLAPLVVTEQHLNQAIFPKEVSLRIAVLWSWSLIVSLGVSFSINPRSSLSTD